MSTMEDKPGGDAGARLAQGTATASLALAAGYLLQYLFQVSVSRVLGADDAGALFIGFALVLLLSVIARLGLDKTGLKLVSGYAAQSDRSGIRELALLLSLLVGLTSMAFASVLILGGSDLTGIVPLPTDETTVFVVFLAIPFVALCFIYAEILRGMRLVGLSGIVQLVLPYGTAVVIVWGSYFAGAHSAYMGALAFVLGFASAVLLGAYFIFKASAGREKPISSHFAGVSRGAPFMLWSSVILFAIASGDVIILGYFVTSGEVAYYFAASRTAMLVSVGMVGINSIVAPMIAVAHRERDNAQLGRIARMGSRLSLAVAVFSIGFLFVLGEWLLSFFGEGYKEHYELLLLLLTGQFVNAAVGAVAFIMFMSDQERHAARILSLVIFAMFIGYLVLIPMLDIRGAALVTAAGMVVWNVSMTRSIYRSHGVSTLADNLPQAVLFLAVLVLCRYVCETLGLHTLYLALLYVLVGPLVLWKALLHPEDRVAMVSVVQRHNLPESSA